MGQEVICSEVFPSISGSKVAHKNRKLEITSYVISVAKLLFESANNSKASKNIYILLI